ncbi:hypothetical protein BX600DRAFT_256183 [Xylariales sp. PMI_506]|nr:hypothetical protein BX600DRAFT_256183 [Xylariales sp. PMI_506]
MQLSKLGHALTWAVGITSVAAAPTVADISVVTRNTPGTTLANTVAGFRRALLDARLNKRQSVWSNQTTIEKTFDGATLFAASGSVKNGNDSADISVVCSTCYVKTTATAQLSVDGNLNVSQAITNATNAVENEFIAIAAAAWNYTEVYLNTLISPSASAPPIDVDFALNIPAIPEVTLSFQFNDTELYMEIDTVIEGSVGYTVTLYKSDTPLGISFEGNNIGIVFTVDLILNANDDIDISSGFHIKLDDGVQFDIALFAKDIAKATL